ncbi:MAG: TonB family protein [Deltaproteobacteria bacterium]|nr:TonB family protein [Deltaproteobacteria bacterium]
MRAYLAELSRRARDAASYPRAARRLGLEGVAVIAGSIAPDGRLLAPRLARSSGSPALDEAALAACRALALPPPDPDLLPALAAVQVPIRFALTAAAR